MRRARVYVELLEAEELDVAANRLPGADRGHHQHRVLVAQLECLRPEGARGLLQSTKTENNVK